MPCVAVASENSVRIDLYDDDHGGGTPVAVIHGVNRKLVEFLGQAQRRAGASQR